MNSQRRIRLCILVLIMFFFASLISCDINDFGNKNEDPTQIQKINPDYQFTSIEISSKGTARQTEVRYAGNMMQYYAQHSSIDFWPGEFYQRRDSYTEQLWTNTYSGGGSGATVRNIVDLRKRLQNMKEEGEPVDNKLAALRVMRVYVFQRLTDTYGDLPYSEAGKGVIDKNYAPVYDSQQSIYTDMFKELKEAVDQFDNSQPSYGSADIIYNGDITKWKKFANSLRLRLALHLVKVGPETAKQQSLAAINADGGVMSSNDDIAYIPHEKGPDLTENQVSDELTAHGPEFIKLSQALANFLKQRDDPRLGIYGKTVVDGAEPVGFPNGYTTEEAQDHSSWISCAGDSPPSPCGLGVYMNLNPMMVTKDTPTFLQTYAEVEFMQAELAVRGWTSDNSETHYNLGIRAAMKYLSMYDDEGGATISNSDIDDYLAANPFKSEGSFSGKLEQINTQYWAALYLNGIDAWINWRRSGYPKLEPAPVDDPNPAPTSDTGGEIPRRMTYPINETFLNRNNFEAALMNQGWGNEDNLMDRVWWDVKK